uniref:Uncharacterized protein n=1 Tax=Glossina austeni TaxID=7395 RepID=A0A1A9URH7_GLOAU
MEKRKNVQKRLKKFQVLKPLAFTNLELDLILEEAITELSLGEAITVFSSAAEMGFRNPDAICGFVCCLWNDDKCPKLNGYGVLALVVSVGDKLKMLLGRIILTPDVLATAKLLSNKLMLLLTSGKRLLTASKRTSEIGEGIVETRAE